MKPTSPKRLRGLYHEPGAVRKASETVGPPLQKATAVVRRISCEAIKAYIDGNLAAGLSPQKAATDLGVSTRYLHKIFAESGYTFCQYLHTRRLECSRWKLTDPGSAHVSINDIALELGFYDHAHYSRSFRKAYGITPRAYRKANGKP